MRAAKLHTILGNAYRTCFDILGNTQDRDQAADHLTIAAEITPEGDRNKARMHYRLGVTFDDDFKKFGIVNDINQAIYLL